VLQAVADYHVRNLGNHMLPRLVDSIEGVRFIADDQVETIFAEGVFRGWQRFWRDLRGATALITLSLPGYSSDHASAVVYMSIFKGDVHGDERVLLLRRQDQRWFIEWSQVLFQS
jgi:hypothetical protein